MKKALNVPVRILASKRSSSGVGLDLDPAVLENVRGAGLSKEVWFSSYCGALAKDKKHLELLTLIRDHIRGNPSCPIGFRMLRTHAEKAWKSIQSMFFDPSLNQDDLIGLCLEFRDFGHFTHYFPNLVVSAVDAAASDPALTQIRRGLEVLLPPGFWVAPRAYAEQYSPGIESVMTTLDGLSGSDIGADHILEYLRVMVRSQAKTPSDLKYLYLEMAVQHADNEDYDEAFEILFRYREEFPGDILVESAIYRVVLLAGKAIANNSEMEESEAMVITVKLLDQLHEAGWVPTRDSMDACLIRATLGDSEKALRLAHAFLDVSPWDHYYLNKAIEISQVLGETSLRDRAYHLISSGLAKYPGRSDLLELSETAFSRHSIRTLLIGQKFAA